MRCYCCDNPTGTKPDPKTDRYYCASCRSSISDTIVFFTLHDETEGEDLFLQTRQEPLDVS